MKYSSAYIFGRQITGNTPPTPPPWKAWWWNSPGACPVRAVDGFLPYCAQDSFGADPFYYVDGTHSNYSGHDIGCDAFEITSTIPWGYNYREHGNTPSYSVAFIPLMDLSDNPSTSRLMLAMDWYTCLPYVDAYDRGSYDVDISMFIYTEQGQYIPLHQTGSRGVSGHFEPDNNHVYLVAGADAFIKQDQSLEENIVYGGLIFDAGYDGNPAVKWGFAAYKLSKLTYNGVKIDKSWYDPS